MWYYGHLNHTDMRYNFSGALIRSDVVACPDLLRVATLPLSLTSSLFFSLEGKQKKQEQTILYL